MAETVIPGIKEGDKACFRFQIPVALAKPGISGQPVIDAQMAFVPCLKSKCMLWNGEEASLPEGSHGECWDVTRARATARIAKLKWDEVVGSEH